MAKSASSKTKLEREKEKAEKVAQKEQLAAEKEKAKQQKEAEKAQAAAAKAAKAVERARVDAEREKLRREKEELRLEKERLQLEREKEKMAREKEKSEKEREKSGKERAKKDKAQEQEKLADRSRSLMSAFLGVAPKPSAIDTQASSPAAVAASPTASDAETPDGSSGPSTQPASAASPVASSSPSSASPTAACTPAQPQPLFHPFQLKPNSSLAPLHRLPSATSDEIDYMTQQHSPASTCTDYPSLASSASSSSTNSIHAAYTRGGALETGRKRRRTLFFRRPSRRNKLIQHLRTFRPPFYGYLPSLPSHPLCATSPFALQSLGVNYDADSDEEWGEEPEGEELGEDDEDGADEEGDGGREAQRGQLRRDGYEEDGDFTVPEDEDEALLTGGLMAEARVMEKGGKKRIVIRPIVVGPWRAGEAVSVEVAELRRRTQWKWCRPLTREVVKRPKEAAEEERVERKESSKPRKRKADSVAENGALANGVNSGTASEEGGTGTSEGQQQHDERHIEQQQQPLRAGDCFTPVVRKKVKRVIVPQLTSAPSSTPSTDSPSSATTSSSPSQLQPAKSELKAVPVAAASADVVCVLSESGLVISEVAMEGVEADGGRGAAGSEAEVSELELSTELSCGELGSDMLTSELSSTD